MATNDKYDRQLRLWGASGQRSLGSTTVVLVGASASGTETLKNLVLPGVGAIHVVDDGDAETVPSCRSASSGGAGAFGDFFVFKEGGGSDGSGGGGGGGDGGESMEVDGEEEKKSPSDDTRSRAEVACANLAELNPDVKGGYTSVPSLSDYADYGPLLEQIRSDNDRSEKLLVVASDLQPAALLPLSSACHDESIPLLIVKSYGLIGSVRVQVKRHVVIESKPDSSVADLRLACPSGLFDRLKTLAEEYADLDAMDSKEHGHVPYVVILIKAMEKWRREKRAADGAGGGAAASEGGGGLEFPKTSEEKSSFREIIKSMSRNFNDELNFQEAYNDAYLAYATKDIPWEVQELIDAASDGDPMDTGDGAASDGKQRSGGGDGKFDILVLALKKFMEENDGQPPLNGSIPDMTAATEPFVALQGAYRSKADEDRTRMRTLVEEVRAKKRGGSGAGAPEIGDEELATFCKNVHNLRTMETRSYAEEYRMHSPPPDDESANSPAASADDPPPSASVSPREQEIRDDLLMSAMDPYDIPEHTPLLWHVALRACESYMSDHGRYPGSDGRTMALSSDADEIHVRMASVAKSMGLAECDLIKTHLLDDPEKKHATEVVRYHNAEVHTVASVVGGVASQEAVKLITGQYVPLDDTYVYNGIAGVGGVYKL